MAARQLPDTETLRKLLRYEPETGKLYWRPRTVFDFPGNKRPKHETMRWNTRYAGKEAFTAVNECGYRHGKLFKKSQIAHIVIWVMCHGEVPVDEIDHRNGDPADNRICNLRPATHGQNMRNVGMRRNNLSGFKGVNWCNAKQKWHAQIGHNCKRINLGYYEDILEADAAYKEASKRLHGEFARAA
jgi:HNH endonuclease/AP2 domain